MKKSYKNRGVYLDVFDSVHDIDPLKAEQALFHEIVNKGNPVVLTFNQLTDSLAFMELWRNENTVNALNFLLQKGMIKINQYYNGTESIRTASQYIQNAIDTMLSGNAFVFSAWSKLGIKMTDLDEIGKAIRYHDIYRIEEHFQHNENKVLLIHYFKMITSLSDSMDAKTYVTPIPTIKKFSDFMGDILASKILEEETIGILEEILHRYSHLSQINARSFWYKEVEMICDESQRQRLKKVIDHCYSLAIMSSIDARCQFDEFELQQALNRSYPLTSNESPDWQIAVRLFQDDKMLEESTQSFQARVYFHFVRNIVYAIFLVTVVVVLLQCIGELFDFGKEQLILMLDGMIHIYGMTVSKIVYTILFFLVIGSVVVIGEYFSSKIFAKLQLPDMLESLNMLRNAIFDNIKLKKYNRKQGESLSHEHIS